MPFIRFETAFDGEDALRGSARLPLAVPAATINACLLALEAALKRFACAELPEILRPKPLKVYPEAAAARPPADPCATLGAKPAARLFDHVARVRQFLRAQPAVALRGVLEGRAPRALVVLVFVRETCQARFTPHFAALPARTRAQLLIDWRDSLVRQAATRGSA